MANSRVDSAPTSPRNRLIDFATGIVLALSTAALIGVVRTLNEHSERLATVEAVRAADHATLERIEDKVDLLAMRTTR